MMTQDEIDMSPRAVAARLDDVRALCRLVLYLGRFKAVESATAQDAEASGSSSSEEAGGAERPACPI
jgi:hypothetical protein